MKQESGRNGVGPMRQYCIGAILLDLENPCRMARLEKLLLAPHEKEREGYLPNVIYSCSSIIHRGELVISYAMSDINSRITTVSVNHLLNRMLSLTDKIKISICLYHLILAFAVISISSCSSLDVSKYNTSIDDIKDSVNSICNTTTKSNGFSIMKFHIDEKYDPSVKRENYSKILYGNSNTAIIMLHGFISSPFEVYALGEKINESGHTVFLPLINGFGGSTALANTAEIELWKSTLEESLESLAPCYSKIIIVGFSLGGTILTDFLFDNEFKHQKPSGAILLAPYFAPKMWGGGFVTEVFDIFCDSISLKTLYKVSGNQDLKIPVSNPHHYNSEMPLKAVKKIIKFGNQIRKEHHQKKVHIPTLFVYTEDDQTVDNKIGIKFINEHFLDLQMIKFSQEKRVRHQLALPAGNEEFDILYSSVINFINQLLE